MQTVTCAQDKDKPGTRSIVINTTAWLGIDLYMTLSIKNDDETTYIKFKSKSRF